MPNTITQSARLTALTMALASCGWGLVDTGLKHPTDQPLVLLDPPTPLPSFFGTEIHNSETTTVERLHNARLPWVRYHGINWFQVEPQPPTWTGTGYEHHYNWSGQAISDIESLHQQGITVDVILFGSPAWASMKGIDGCAPPQREYLWAFKAFVEAAVTRLPFVDHWEIGNEPDIIMLDYLNFFGCWSDPDDEQTFDPDPYRHGGRYYADALKEVYPAIKALNNDANVILGGLMMGCGTDANGGGDCSATKGTLTFLDGVLENGGAPYFDTVAFHSYPTYFDDFKMREIWMMLDMPYTWENDFDLTYGDWYDRGGMLKGKIQTIRNKLNASGVPNKSIIMNEGGLLCPPYIEENQDYPEYSTEVNEKIKTMRKLCANVGYAPCSTGCQNESGVVVGKCAPNVHGYRNVCVPEITYSTCTVGSPCGTPGSATYESDRFRLYCLDDPGDDCTTAGCPGTCQPHKPEWGIYCGGTYGPCPEGLGLWCLTAEGFSTNPTTVGKCEYPPFTAKHADYVHRLYIRALSAGIQGFAWYQLSGNNWQQGDLIRTSDHSYRALAFLTSILTGASFVRQVPQDWQMVESYEFCKGTSRYEFTWWNEEAGILTSPVPDGAEVFDVYGTKQDSIISGGQVLVYHYPNSCQQ